MIITVVRKPLANNVCENITLHNTGGINIEECRVGNEDTRSPTSLSALGQKSGWNNHENRVVLAGSANGRWPANVLFQNTQILDNQSEIIVSKFFKVVREKMTKDTYRNIILVRKPISEPNLALNVEKHSTCALNVKQTQIQDRWTRNMIVDKKVIAIVKKQCGENVFKVVSDVN